MRISDWSSDVCSSDLCLKADDKVCHHFGIIIGPNANGRDPGQEFRITLHVADEIEHLLRTIGQMAGFTVLWHRFPWRAWLQARRPSAQHPHRPDSWSGCEDSTLTEGNHWLARVMTRSRSPADACGKKR